MPFIAITKCIDLNSSQLTRSLQGHLTTLFSLVPHKELGTMTSGQQLMDH